MENGIPSREELLRNRDGRNPANSFPAERPAVKKRIEEIKKKYKGTIGSDATPIDTRDLDFLPTKEMAAESIHAAQKLRDAEVITDEE